MEDNDVSSFRVRQRVGQLIYNHKLPINQAWLHTVPFHPYPRREHIDDEKQDHSEQDGLKDGSNEAQNPPNDARRFGLYYGWLRRLVKGVLSHGLDYKTRYKG